MSRISRHSWFDMSNNENIKTEEISSEEEVDQKEVFVDDIRNIRKRIPFNEMVKREIKQESNSGDSTSFDEASSIKEQTESKDEIMSEVSNDGTQQKTGHKRSRKSSDGECSNKKQSKNGNRSPSTSSSSTNSSTKDKETDPEILVRRQKQIDYGKNTVGYDRYLAAIPKQKRTKDHPKTPPKNAKYSRRAWDGLIKVWRQKLHYWDPEEEEESDLTVMSPGDVAEDKTSIE